ncbi:MAG: HEPN domain-containing protein [Ardenticatenia bacterium]|nr:HEPN domain-containing protein [Ardenticatenia bacterium]
MAFTWTYVPWQASEPVQPRPLDPDVLLHVFPRPKPNPSAADWAFFADVSYLSCRILMLSSQATHFEALYCAGQTIEKYMKAIWRHRAGATARTNHALVVLAELLALTYPDLDEFADSSFLETCRRLEPFDVGGRYPDTTLGGRAHSLELLTFLDGFVAHCRDLLGLDPAAPINLVASVLGQGGHSIMLAASEAVREENHYLDALTGSSNVP